MPNVVFMVTRRFFSGQESQLTRSCNFFLALLVQKLVQLTLTSLVVPHTVVECTDYNNAGNICFRVCLSPRLRCWCHQSPAVRKVSLVETSR